MAEIADHGMMQKICCTARIDIEKDNSMLAEAEIDKIVEIKLIGKVKELRAAEAHYPGNMTIEVYSVDTKSVGEFDGIEDDA